MKLVKKCLIEFNNQWTNQITKKEVNNDVEFRFTLLDMQKFAKYYHKQKLTLTDVVKSFVCPNGCGKNGDMGSCIECVGK